MKTFKQGSWDNGLKCPLCNTDNEGEVVLVPINETIEGNLAEAKQIHSKCIQDRWLYIEKLKAIVVR